MSECDKFKLQFSDYLDGELPQVQRKELDDHLSICWDCAETIKQIKIIQESLRNIPTIATGPDFEHRLHDQLHNLSGGGNIFPLTMQNWKLPAMGSAIVLATVGLFYVFNHSVDTNNPSLNGGGSFYPAATQVPASSHNYQLSNTPANQADYSQNPSREDSLSNDTVQVNQNGVQLVGDNK